MKDKMFVLGLDGMPFTFLENSIIKENMPFFSGFCQKNKAHKMNSVIPVISSVAWTNYSTGKNPGEHGIYGFVDKINAPFRLIVPTSRDRKAETIFYKLSKEKKVFSINVPISYPPEPISGKNVSCFLCPDIKKSTYPEDYWKELNKKGYIIDVDASLIRKNPLEMLKQLIRAMEIRFELALSIMEEEWDFIQLHIMETDRLLHFFYTQVEGNSSVNEKEMELIKAFFQRLDYRISKLLKVLGEDCKVLILSDHGMCKIKKEVQINLWLRNQGWLQIDDGQEIENYKKETICYSLTPGRIYINREGKEEKGYVRDKDYEQVRDMIKDSLLNIRYGKETIIDKVFKKEDLYSGNQLYLAPDLIALPKDGFDLKAGTTGDCIYTNSYLNGMHTFENAMIVGKNVDIRGVNSIEQVHDVVMRSMA